MFLDVLAVIIAIISIAIVTVMKIGIMIVIALVVIPVIITIVRLLVVTRIIVSMSMRLLVQAIAPLVTLAKKEHHTSGSNNTNACNTMETIRPDIVVQYSI